MIKAIKPDEIDGVNIVCENAHEAIINHINNEIKKRKTELDIRGSVKIYLEEIFLWAPSFKLYHNDENWNIICDLYEQAGWSCRYGICIKWQNSQDMQRYYFEVSNKMTFNHRRAADYTGELIQGENETILYKSPGVWERSDGKPINQ